MSKTDVFYCEVRERTGTSGAREARRQGFVPGIIYGGDKAPVAIRLREKEIVTAHQAGRMRAHLAKIEVPGQDYLQPVIAREVQVDPVRGMPIHVDLLRVDEKTRIDVEIPVRFINEELSPGLKRGGMLNIVRHTIEVFAPAIAIPEFFTIDVTGLDIGDSIHISAVTLPEGVVPTITDRDFTIATIAAPTVLKASEEGAVEGQPASPAEAAEKAGDKKD